MTDLGVERGVEHDGVGRPQRAQILHDLADIGGSEELSVDETGESESDRLAQAGDLAARQRS